MSAIESTFLRRVFFTLTSISFVIILYITTLQHALFSDTASYSTDLIDPSNSAPSLEYFLNQLYFSLNYSNYHSFRKCPLEFLKERDSAHRYIHPNIFKEKSYYFAINLFNSEEILPNMLVQLINVLSFLNFDNIYISIYENGSTDQTQHLLKILQNALTYWNIPHSIISEEYSRPQVYHRIEYLASIRNKALRPLRKLYKKTKRRFDKIVFINDILFCSIDVLELILQAESQQADLTCGLDYTITNNHTIFYDTWVARDMRGRPFKPRKMSLVGDRIGAKRYLRHQPFQVQCCWNGMAVIDSELFYPPFNVRFRRSDPGECSASECSLLCNDFYYHNKERIIIVPSVQVAYNQATYYTLGPSFLYNSTTYSIPSNFTSDLVPFRPGPNMVKCYPLDELNTHDPSRKPVMQMIK